MDTGEATLPTCTSAGIARRNLDGQIGALAARHRHRPHPSVGDLLVRGLLQRHSITADHDDLLAADRVAEELVASPRPVGPSWVSRARVSIALHRFDQAQQALTAAEDLGTPRRATAEERADLLEVSGRHRAALRLRRTLADTPDGPPSGPDDGSQRATRLACLLLVEDDPGRASTMFGDGLRRYRGPSPIPLAAMLVNWGHALEHAGRPDHALSAYRSATRYLPAHVRAHRGTAQCAWAVGDIDIAITSARTACELNPRDPISAGLLGLVLRDAGHPGHARHLQHAHRLFTACLRLSPEAWAAHAAEFWLDEATHPHAALAAARINLAARATPAALRLGTRAASDPRTHTDRPPPNHPEES